MKDSQTLKIRLWFEPDDLWFEPDDEVRGIGEPLGLVFIAIDVIAGRKFAFMQVVPKEQLYFWDAPILWTLIDNLFRRVDDYANQYFREQAEENDKM